MIFQRDYPIFQRFPMTEAGGAGGSFTISDEGSSLGTASILNFAGAGVTAVLDTDTATVTIPGGGGASQTPWIGNVDAEGYQLNDVNVVQLTRTRPTILFDQGTTAKGRVQQMTASPGVGILANLTYDGTNFQRDDTAQSATVLTLGASSMTLRYAPAGANPATTTTPFTFDCANNRLGINAAAATGSALDVRSGYTYLNVPNAAPTDGNLPISSVCIYLDEATNTMKFRVKYSGGTLKIFSAALT